MTYWDDLDRWLDDQELARKDVERALVTARRFRFSHVNSQGQGVYRYPGLHGGVVVVTKSMFGGRFPQEIELRRSDGGDGSIWSFPATRGER